MSEIVLIGKSAELVIRFSSLYARENLLIRQMAELLAIVYVRDIVLIGKPADLAIQFLSLYARENLLIR